MGSVYEEFEQQIAGWKLKYAGRPRREIMHLLYRSLEREGPVAIAYRDELMLHRLLSAPLCPLLQQGSHTVGKEPEVGAPKDARGKFSCVGEP